MALNTSSYSGAPFRPNETIGPKTTVRVTIFPPLIHFLNNVDEEYLFHDESKRVELIGLISEAKLLATGFCIAPHPLLNLSHLGGEDTLILYVHQLISRVLREIPDSNNPIPADFLPIAWTEITSLLGCLADTRSVLTSLPAYSKPDGPFVIREPNYSIEVLLYPCSDSQLTSKALLNPVVNAPSFPSADDRVVIGLSLEAVYFSIRSAGKFDLYMLALLLRSLLQFYPVLTAGGLYRENSLLNEEIRSMSPIHPPLFAAPFTFGRSLTNQVTMAILASVNGADTIVQTIEKRRMHAGVQKWLETLLVGSQDAVRSAVTEIRAYVWAAQYHQHDHESRQLLEETLIMLQGMDDIETRREAVILHTNLLDAHDWQTSVPFEPTVGQIGDKWRLLLTCPPEENPQETFVITSTPIRFSRAFSTHADPAITAINGVSHQSCYPLSCLVAPSQAASSSEVPAMWTAVASLPSPQRCGFFDFQLVRPDISLGIWRPVFKSRQHGIQGIFDALHQQGNILSKDGTDTENRVLVSPAIIHARTANGDIPAAVAKLLSVHVGGSGGQGTLHSTEDIVKAFNAAALSDNIYPTQGRFIVQSANFRTRQVCEVFVDEIEAKWSKDGSLEKRGSFASVRNIIHELKAKDSKISTLHLVGALARDNGKRILTSDASSVRFENPDASHFAPTCRATPCELLGGFNIFKDLAVTAQSLGIELSIDMVTRISSSNAHRKYKGLGLSYVDDNGKRVPFFGADGRGIQSHESLQLNLRDIRAWDTLLNDLLSWGMSFGVSMARLEHGDLVPELFDRDEEEMDKFDPDGENHYTDRERLLSSVVLPAQRCSVYSDPVASLFPNVFLSRLLRKLWARLPVFSLVGEITSGEEANDAISSISRTGALPLSIAMPARLGRVLGKSLRPDGSVADCPAQPANSVSHAVLADLKMLPPGGAYFAASSTPSSPSPLLLFGRGAWSAVDLLFSMPAMPWTLYGEMRGLAFRLDYVSLFTDVKSIQQQAHQQQLEQQSNMNKNRLALTTAGNNPVEISSQQSRQHYEKLGVIDGPSASVAVSPLALKTSTGGVVRTSSKRTFSQLLSSSSSNLNNNMNNYNDGSDSFQPLSRLRSLNKFEDVTKISQLEESHRQLVGPQFGFDIKLIEHHYNHRQQLRSSSKALHENDFGFMPLSVSKADGSKHERVLSFAKCHVKSGFSQEECSMMVINLHHEDVEVFVSIANLKPFISKLPSTAIVALVDLFETTEPATADDANKISPNNSQAPKNSSLAPPLLASGAPAYPYGSKSLTRVGLSSHRLNRIGSRMSFNDLSILNEAPEEDEYDLDDSTTTEGSSSRDGQVKKSSTHLSKGVKRQLSFSKFFTISDLCSGAIRVALKPFSSRGYALTLITMSPFDTCSPEKLSLIKLKDGETLLSRLLASACSRLLESPNPSRLLLRGNLLSRALSSAFRSFLSIRENEEAQFAPLIAILRDLLFCVASPSGRSDLLPSYLSNVSSNPSEFISSDAVTQAAASVLSVVIKSAEFHKSLNESLHSQLPLSSHQPGFTSGLLSASANYSSPISVVNASSFATTTKVFAALKKIEKAFVHEPDEKQSRIGRLARHTLKSCQHGPIVFVTPELGKWSTVGGLGVMVDELTCTLASHGQEVWVISPYYHFNKRGEIDYLLKDNILHSFNTKIIIGGELITLGVHRGIVNGVNLLFLHQQSLFPVPYPDLDYVASVRFLVGFARGCLQALCDISLQPATIVSNDWATGLVPAFAKFDYANFFSSKNTQTLHIVHNLDSAYEGRVYPPRGADVSFLFAPLNPELLIDPLWQQYVVNPSRCALLTADQWATVSKSYRDELMGIIGGQPSALRFLLGDKRRFPAPFAFPNGIPIEIREAKQRALGFDDTGFLGHCQAKEALQKKYFGFEKGDQGLALFAFIGRVTVQKGVHLICEAAEQLILKTNFRCQILIGGMASKSDPYGQKCARMMHDLRRKYPYNIWADPESFFYDGTLVNLGADFGLMPSLFEPGGIVQHEFFVAGTPVIAFKTGGLRDTVLDYMNFNTGGGFTFQEYSSGDLLCAITRALEVFWNSDGEQKEYRHLRNNAKNAVVSADDVADAWLSEFGSLKGDVSCNWHSVEEAANLMAWPTEQPKTLSAIGGQPGTDSFFGDHRDDFQQI